MNYGRGSFSILIAEDDEDDYLLITEALEGAGVKQTLEWVHNGEDLLEFLQNAHLENGKNPVKPGLIFLDLNMPKLDGREALKLIKGNPLFCRIPVVILTTSQAVDDVNETYNLGANSFLHKSPRYQEFVQSLKVASSYWLDTVKLPL